MPKFPATKANRLLRILTSKPLNYRIVRASGSHKILVAEGRRRIIFSYHGDSEIEGSMIKFILVKEVGLNEEEAWQLLH